QSQVDDLPSMTGGGAKGGSATPRPRANLQSTSKTWPTYDRFFVDLSGRLWVQDWIHPLKGKVDSWTAFDSTGKLIGRLNIPAPSERQRRGQVLGFGKDEVFLKRFDADSALHLTAYPLVPRK
ncbi:MAG: hypothetical protein H7Z40_09335, partial [Phycisphaerae bacterium]|nr:hypothetical protein [Gemmatimonadaceae bacterium]